MTDLEYRCIHGHDKCAEMYPGPECPYCERIYAAPFVTDLGEWRVFLKDLSDVALAHVIHDLRQHPEDEDYLQAVLEELRARAREDEGSRGPLGSRCGEGSRGS